MAKEYTNLFHSNIYPNCDFGFENVPSGSPERAGQHCVKNHQHGIHGKRE
jgi:hypothetical protein